MVGLFRRAGVLIARASLPVESGCGRGGQLHMSIQKDPIHMSVFRDPGIAKSKGQLFGIKRPCKQVPAENHRPRITQPSKLLPPPCRDL